MKVVSTRLFSRLAVASFLGLVSWLLPPAAALAQVGIGTTTPDASAQLELQTTTRGFLPPRMSAIQMAAIAAPAPGLVVYNTTVNQLYYRDGGTNTWLPIGTGAVLGDDLGNHTATANIRLSGNWLSNDGGNEGVFVTTAGNVGIGIATPLALFHVQGNSQFMSGGAGTPLAVTLGRTAADLEFGVAGGFTDFSNFANIGDAVIRSNTSHLILTARNASGNIYFGSGAVDAQRMTMLNNGNFGIGTITPGAQLHTTGTVRFGGLGTTATLTGYELAAVNTTTGQVERFTGTLPGDNLGNHTATANLNMGNNLIVGTNNTSGIQIDANGNVGINIAPNTANRLLVSQGTSVSGDAAIRGENVVGGINPTYGVYGSTASNASLGAGVYGTTFNAGSGVYGENTSAANNSAGVRGVQSANTASTTYGVFGSTASTVGTSAGVFGTTATAGYGVIGRNTGTMNNSGGLLGQHTTTTGNVTYGVIGTTASTAATAAGVYGYSSTAGYGVHGYNDGSLSNSAGIFGYSNPTATPTNQTFGVVGITNSSHNFAAGVYGESNNNAFGVYGRANVNVANATGVRGIAGGAGANTTYGVYGSTLSSSSNGAGVYGNGSIFGAVGVRAESGGTGAALHALNTSTGLAALIDGPANFLDEIQAAGAPGSAGQVLTSSGAGLPPTWSNVSGADNWGAQVVQTTGNFTGNGTTGNELQLSNTGVTAGPYTPSGGGTSIDIPGFNVDGFGRITGASTTTINVGDDWGTQAAITSGVITGDGGGSAIRLADGTAANQVPVWDGSAWSIAAAPGDGWGTDVATASGFLTGDGTGGDPLRFINGTAIGDMPYWNGTAWAAGTNPNQWSHDGTNVWRPAGNVGIGVATPANARLAIAAPTNGVYAMMGHNQGATKGVSMGYSGFYSYTGFNLYYDGSGNQRSMSAGRGMALAYDASSGTIVFRETLFPATAADEVMGGQTRLQILGNGNVGVGGSGTVPYRFHVGGNASPGIITQIGLENPSAPANGHGNQMVFASQRTGGIRTDVGAVGGLISDISNGQGDVFLSAHNGTALTEMFRVRGNGTVGVGTATPARRLHVAGGLRVDTLAGGGTGVQLVTTDNNGDLYRIPTGGGVLVNDGAGNMFWGGVGGDDLGNHTATTQIQSTAGTAAAPGYSFSGNLNTGIFSPNANELALSTAGTQRMIVDAAGNVGIGTATASNVLVNAEATGSRNTTFLANLNNNLSSPGNSYGFRALAFNTAAGVNIRGFDANVIQTVANQFAIGIEVSGSVTGGGTGIAYGGVFQATSNATPGPVGIHASVGGNGANTAVRAGRFITAAGTAITAGGSSYALDAQNQTTGGQFAYGLSANVTSTATTNYGVYSSVSGATNNYSGIFMGGNFGIGTATPGAQLHTTGSVRFAGAPTNGTFTPATDDLLMVNAAGDVQRFTGTLPGDNLGNHLATTNLDMNGSRIRLAGIADDNHALRFAGTVPFNATTIDGPVLYGFQGGALGSKNGGTEVFAMRWDVNGNVGIGTTTPGAKLHTVGVVRHVGLGTSGTLTGHNLAAINSTTGDVVEFTGTLPGDNLGNHTATANVTMGSNWLSGDGGSEGLFVDAAGNVGVQNATPAMPLDVTGNANITGAYHIGGTSMLRSPAATTVSVGNGAGNANNENTFMGYTAGQGMTGQANAVYGAYAGLLGAGSFNTYIGVSTNYQGGNGSGNTYLGYEAGYSNIDGDNNTLLGRRTELLAGGLTNATAIGHLAAVGASNSIILGSINGTNGATANTNVGIGTTAPAARLHTVGAVRHVGLGTSGALAGHNLAAINTTTGELVEFTGTLPGDNLGNHIATAQIQSTAGTAAAPGYSFSGDLNTGVFSPGADILSIATAGTERVRVLANGNVGIGTTNAPELLTLNGNILFTAGAAVPKNISVQDNGGGSGRVLAITAGSSIAGGGSGGNLQLAAGSALGAGAGNGGNVLVYGGQPASGTVGNVVLAHNGSVSIGNVGIGTTTPAAQLHTTGSVRFAGAPTSGTFTDASDDFLFVNAAGDVQRFTGTLPGDNLGNHIATAQVQGIAGSNAAPSYSFIGDLNTGIYNSGADQVSVVTGGNQRVLVNEFGNVGIGSATADARLDVQSTTSATSGVLDGSTFRNVLNNTAASTAQVRASFSELFLVGTASHAGGQAYGAYNSVRKTSNSTTGQAAGSYNVTTVTATGSIINTAYGSINLVENQHAGAGIGTGIGIQGRALNTNNATMTALMGGQMGISNNSAGTVTSGYALNLEAPINSGTITNYASLMISEITAAGLGSSRAISYSHSTNPFVVMGDGNVGIGTTAPAARLHTNGTVRMATLATSGTFTDASDDFLFVNAAGDVQRYTGTLPGDNLGNHTATANVIMGSNWLSGDGGNEGVRVDNVGRIGVNSAAPTEVLHVFNSANDVNAIAIEMTGTGSGAQAGLNVLTQGNGATRIGNAGTKGWSFWGRADGYVFPSEQNDLFISSHNGGTTVLAMHLDAPTGNVGIGVNGAATRLDVAGAVRVGTTADAASAANQGAIRYNGGSLQYSDGAAWQTVGLAGAGDNLGNHTATLQILGTAGTNAAPGYSFGGSTGTGMYAPAANQVALATNGLQRMMVDANGNVGIGTAPAADVRVMATGSGSINTIYRATINNAVSAGSATTGFLSQGSNSSAGVNITGYEANVTQTVANQAAFGINTSSTVSGGGTGIAYGGAFFATANTSQGPVGVYGSVGGNAANTSVKASRFLTIGGTAINAAGSSYAIEAQNQTTGGANAYGIHASATGTATNNYGVFATVSGGTNNYAGVFQGGNVGVGTTAPSQLVEANNGNVLISSTTVTPGELRLEEGTTSAGNHYTAFRAADQATNITYTLPTADGTSGQVLSTNGTGTLSWATAGGADNLGNHIATTQIQSTAGTNAAPGYSFAGDLNTGAFNPGADQFAIATAGTQRMVVDASGNVGIGTASPDNILRVQSLSPHVRIEATGGTAQEVNLGMFQNQAGTRTYGTYFSLAPTTSNFSIVTRNNNVDNARIVIDNATGSIGMGTATPTDVLALQRDNITSTLSNTVYSSSSGHQPRVFFNKAGGSSGTPSGVLTGDVLGNLNFTGHTGGGFAMGAVMEATVAGDFNVGNSGTNIAFSTAALGSNSLVERFRIQHNGNIGIGTAAPAAQLHTTGSARFAGVPTNAAFADASDDFLFVNAAGDVQRYTGTMPGDNLGNHIATTQIQSTAGTNTAPGYSFAGDLNTGIYRSAADELSITTAGTQRMFVLADGKVQIGAPWLPTSNNLQVGGFNPTLGIIDGTLINTAGNALGTLNFGDGLVATPQAQIKAWRDAAAAAGDVPAALLFSTVADGTTALTERMRIANSGNVGIGTTNPTSRLQVETSSNATSGIVNGSVFLATLNNTAASTAQVRASVSEMFLTGTASHAGGRAYGAYNSVQKVNNVTTSEAAGAYNVVTVGASGGVVNAAYGSFNVADNQHATAGISIGIGTQGRGLNTGTALMSALMGGQMGINNNGTGTVSNGYAINLEAPVNSGGGTITNYASLMIAEITAAGIGTARAIRYDHSTNPFVVMGNGNVGIGTLNPAAQLHTTGTARFAGLATTGTFAAATDDILIVNAAGDVQRFTGTMPGDNLGNHLMLTDLITDNNWITGDGDTEGLFVNFSGNVGIGTNTPQNLLHVNDLNNSSAALQLTAGTATGTSAGDGLMFKVTTSEASITQHENAPLILATNSTARVNIDQNGLVGIGCAPGLYGGGLSIELEESAGSIILNQTGNTYAPQFQMIRNRGTEATPLPVVTGNVLGTFGFLGRSTTNNFLSGATIEAIAAENFTSTTASGSSLAFSTTPVGTSTTQERLRITAAGNIGIGTPTPNNKMVILSADATTTLLVENTGVNSNARVVTTMGGLIASMLADGATGQVGVGTLSNSELHLFANGVSRMFINPSGNVGIGVSGPGAQLHVQTAATTEVRAISTATNNVARFVARANALQLQLDADASSSQAIVGTTTAHDMAFRTNATERMRITAAGNVGIGATPNWSLHVNDAVNTFTNLQITNTSSTGTTATDGLIFQVNAGQASIMNREASNLVFGTSAVTQMTITAAGNVGVGVTAPVEPLEVAGNIRTQGEFVYHTARNRVLSVGPAGFTAQNLTDTNIVKMQASNAGMYIQGSTTVNTSAVAFKDIHLPDGAVVDSITAYLFDNDGFATNAQVILRRTTVDGGGVATMAAAAAAANGGAQIITSGAVPGAVATVNNQLYRYSLEFRGNKSITNATNCRLSHVRVLYRVNRAD